MGYFKQKFRSVKKFPDWVYWLPARLMMLMLKCCYRVEMIDPGGRIKEGGIAVTWHNRLFFFAAVFPPEVRHKTYGVISASRDGQYIADLIKQFGVGNLRGSSSRGGANALREAVAMVKEGCNVVFTCDGPRGPRYRLKPGPVLLASRMGKRVIPISINASSYWSLKSWDAFQIPKPGAKLTILVSDGLQIPQDLDDDGIEFWRQKIEDELNRITRD